MVGFESGHRHRRGAARLGHRERRPARPRPRRARRARRADHPHLRRRAALPAPCRGAPDVLGRRARGLRRPDRCARPRRHVLVPARRPDAHQAQHPGRHRPHGRRAAVALAWLARRRPALQHRLRRSDRAAQPGAPGHPRRQPVRLTAAGPAHLHRRRAPGLHHRAPRGLPRDGVRRPPRGRPRRPARVPHGLRALGPAGLLPRRDPGRPRRRRGHVHLLRPRLLLPRLPHPPRRRPHGLLRTDGVDRARPRRPPALGQSLHHLDAGDLAARYPRFGDFVALRDRLDPDRVLTNPYLDRVLGA
ncbi:hypothetical protein G5V59_05830 [Nocardioides sp. W3-2-3]|nr:hypothetical protein [Nocardioides convexus]